MINGVLMGIKSYGKAFTLVSELKLWRYLIVPILIALLIFSVIVIPMFFLYSVTKGFLGYWDSETANNVFFEVAHYTEIAMFFIVGKIFYKHLAMAILSPVMSPVSTKIETHLYGDTHKHIETTFMKSLSRGLRINTRNFIREMLLTMLLFLFGLIPIIGLASIVLLFIVHAYYAGFSNMDPTLERHHNYRDSIRFVKKHRGIAIGNGAIFLLCLFIPLVGLIVSYPISFIAASVATLETINKDHQNLEPQELKVTSTNPNNA